MQNLLIFGGGLLAFAPATSGFIWVLVSSLQDSGAEGEAAAAGLGILGILTIALSIIAAVAFIAHVWMGDNKYSGNEKIFWTLGTLPFAPAVAPVYWYITICHPWLNRSNFDRYGKL